MISDTEANEIYAQAEQSTIKQTGNYNQVFYTQTHDGQPVVVKTPLPMKTSTYPVDIDFAMVPSIQSLHNYQVLAEALDDPKHSFHIAQLYHIGKDGRAIFEHVHGQLLQHTHPWGTSFPQRVMDAIPISLRRAARLIDPSNLYLPDYQPENRDTSAYAQLLCNHAIQYTKGIWNVYGPLLKKLGTPDQPFEKFNAQIPKLQEAEFIAYTGDFHRDNVMVDDQMLSLFDLDLSKYGPLASELAILKMRSLLPDSDFQILCTQIEKTLPPSYTKGLQINLSHFLAFEAIRETISNTVHHANEMKKDPHYPFPAEAFCLHLNPARHYWGNPVGMKPEQVKQIFNEFIQTKNHPLNIGTGHISPDRDWLKRVQRDNPRGYS